MKERRLEQRRSARIPAKAINPIGMALEVLVVDISTSGARLEVMSGAPLASHFSLYINHLNEIKQAELVWRGRWHARIRFVQPGEESKTLSQQSNTATSKRLSPQESRKMTRLQPWQEIGSSCLGQGLNPSRSFQ
jgi:hypothetical protein